MRLDSCAGARRRQSDSPEKRESCQSVDASFVDGDVHRAAPQHASAASEQQVRSSGSLAGAALIRKHLF